MQSYPTISIITPSLNQGDFIEKTLLSVLSQEYPNLEYLVVDGGSSDKTLKILEKYNQKIKWISERDRGQTDAINKGLKMTSGSIVGYLNADDLLAPGALWKTAEIFSTHQDAMWLIGRCNIIDEYDQVSRGSITSYKNLLLHVSSFPTLVITNYISQPATFWRRCLIDEFGLFDETLHYVMDYEYWLKLYSKYPPFLTPAYLASFRVHQHSKTTAKGHSTAYIDEEKVIIQRYTKSQALIFLHNAHRALMTLIYSIINRQ
jgi:glycosyltransferase involved in cell wall biosynthesis